MTLRGPTVAVLGTGTMGSAMARSLLRGGLPVRVWNRTPERAAPLAPHGAVVLHTPRAAVAGADIVLTMLTDADAVAASLPERGEFVKDVVWIQSSTVGVDGCRRLQALAEERGIVYVDAPVLGSSDPAESGDLVILASGPSSVRERCEPVFARLAHRTLWLGRAGYGSRLKLVANAWLLTSVVNLAETLSLAGALGVDPVAFLAAIADGPVDMPYAHSKGPAMLNGQAPPGFALRHALKDARLVLAASRESGGDPIVLEAVEARMARAAELGYADDDLAAAVAASREAARG
jgi:3-hydroxyisobutyrate dehydrogenase